MRIITMRLLTSLNRGPPRVSLWTLFSSDETHRRVALKQYHPRSEIGVHLHNLMAYHNFGEGNMAHTFEDMQREAREWLIEHYLDQLAPEERLKGLPEDEVLKQYDPDEVLKQYEPEERLKGLDPAAIEAWLAKQRRDH